MVYFYSILVSEIYLSIWRLSSVGRQPGVVSLRWCACCCYLPLGLKTLINNLCVAGERVEATNIKLIHIK